MDYTKILKFKGTWRNYQARVLDNTEKYISDGKIHIVAAPGSGKTTLGIELIGRMGEPTLILTPSVTIREQWEARIVEAFLNDGLEPSNYISQNLKDPRVITIATYQALHCAMNKYKGVLEEDDTTVGSLDSDDKIAKRASEENVDYSDFDLVSEMKNCGIKTICLDECHHLRTEWWKALDEFKQGLDNPKMIALTATPPYDSTPALWKRYTDMCGDIDEEISIPELVKEGSLCPHQDYVYFNYPTEAEIAEIEELKKHINDNSVAEIMTVDGENTASETADKQVVNNKSDVNKIIDKDNEKIDKILLTSKAKSKSIREIVKAEANGFGEKLRMLILTDYIRKEYENLIGTDEEIISLGVLPFFEQLRRVSDELGDVRLGVLCGTIVIIPAEAKEALVNAVGDTGKVTFSPIGQLAETDYLKVNAVGDSHFLTGAVTEIFTKGYIKVLIGTKSLLGEGWDSPCINSLILASFVGSFMLSNQMRGRAIRMFKQEPEKTSNIWHLVCLLPTGYGDGTGENSGDYKLLERRFEHFLGLHYEEDIIENGIKRLSIITNPLDENHISEINAKMLEMSCQREELRDRWMKALCVATDKNVVDQTEIEDFAISDSQTNKALEDIKKAKAGMIAGALLSIPLLPVGLIVLGASAVSSSKAKKQYEKVKDPTTCVKNIGEGIYHALLDNGLLEEANAEVVAEIGKNNRQIVYLKSNSGRDKLNFAKCISQFFSAINDQRYILAKRGDRKGDDAYYCVPDIFAKNKEDAQHFYELIMDYIGDYELVYTRSDMGKKTLETARAKSVADARERTTNSKTMK